MIVLFLWFPRMKKSPIAIRIEQINKWYPIILPPTGPTNFVKVFNVNQISLNSLYYSEACNEFAGPIYASLRLSYTAHFEIMSQWWRTVATLMLDQLNQKFSFCSIIKIKNMMCFCRTIPRGKCEQYNGLVCGAYLNGVNIFVDSFESQEEMEIQIKQALTRICEYFKFVLQQNRSVVERMELLLLKLKTQVRFLVGSNQRQ